MRRLSESATNARLFGEIARKQATGAALTNLEFEEILYVGRAAEHNLLVFKSLANKDLGLSNPDPMPKIVDVSGGSDQVLHYLLAGVGRPMEWDWIVPYFGRHAIVKGSVYSYYEFESKEPMTDADWRTKFPAAALSIENSRGIKPEWLQPHPDWIVPFVSRMNLTCPPRNPF